MITVQQAVSIIKSSVKQVKTEYIDAINSNSRVLASEIKAIIDSPPFDMSSMDGYAIKAKKNNFTDHYKVSSEIFAGDNKKVNISYNEAIRVFTGSRIPKGTNRVIIQENCKEINKSEIIVNYNKKDDLFIRKKGQDFKKGSQLLKKFHRINPRDIGLLVSSGVKKVLVYKKPKIAILATGNELISINKKINESQIYASSIFMLKEFINYTNSYCTKLKIIKDDQKEIINTIKNLKNVDLIITTGGVSVGKKDLVKKSLESLGMQTKFWKVKVRPGKPILFGTLKNIPFFGLPGNPVSSYVCFIVFVLEAIKKLSPATQLLIKKSKAYPLKKIANNSFRETYFRGKFYIKNSTKFVNIFDNQDSSFMKTLSLSNCLVKINANKTVCPHDLIEIIELSNGI
ncbi:MAG: hypothetical protein CMJ06_05835 [Pelagibacterales bacterium]|mgnify:CR=1 FL=1|nr:hypothetical protein [Pelagibacterales bacterium]OUU61298.1 MAG: hypothetical protein CBC22_07980 [Alphaproteobacteria bacterium TMED62]|tara:strand:+ start:12632 stop:13831 length:1200 start_codon:yes stop_codon:yes gene_type:complete